MLTIFTIPKPFLGYINVIQRNAIQSWLMLRPKCEVILFGDENGVVEISREFNIRYISEIKKNEFGTPLLDSVFNLAQKLASHHLLVYVNSDIILMHDFIEAVQHIKKPLFLMAGRRWDCDVKESINFNAVDWEAKLYNRIIKEGKLHGYSGIDYFVFPINLPHNLPPLAVGRPGWDNWLIYHARSLKIPVIDITKVVTVVHQNHEFSHLRIKKDISKKLEAQRNLKLAGGFSNMCTLRDADRILTSEGLKRPEFLRRVLSELSLFYPWRLSLSIKRNLQQFL